MVSFWPHLWIYLRLWHQRGNQSVRDLSFQTHVVFPSWPLPCWLFCKLYYQLALAHLQRVQGAWAPERDIGGEWDDIKDELCIFVFLTNTRKTVVISLKWCNCSFLDSYSINWCGHQGWTDDISSANISWYLTLQYYCLGLFALVCTLYSITHKDCTANTVLLKHKDSPQYTWGFSQTVHPPRPPHWSHLFFSFLTAAVCWSFGPPSGSKVKTSAI